ncbi:twin-arginine translocase TatA/TatE family subunit [Microbacterium hibisci]|uniref:twin-arginine translocase TatA/TatE family subunit n=1 Tax=Microbacterium hibisci TaxID=2036000 RepID=UPI001943DE94|nr:twin-arginine translocase TatA/TatE family subunit [Microbacterium hibisci]
MLANINGMHLILVLVVVLLLFGAARLPALAKGVGQSVRILKTETKSSPAEPPSADGASRGET